MIEMFTVGPARDLKASIAGALAAGAPRPMSPSSIPSLDWTYDVNRSFSKSKNSPYDGSTFRGGPVATIVDGAGSLAAYEPDSLIEDRVASRHRDVAARACTPIVHP